MVTRNLALLQLAALTWRASPGLGQPPPVQPCPLYNVKEKEGMAACPPPGPADAFVFQDFALPAAAVLCCAYAGMMAFTPLGQVLETLA